MNVRKRCVRFTTAILAIAVGLILTAALFHQQFCKEGSATLTSLGEEVVKEKPAEKEVKKKKIKKRRAKKENIRSQQSKIKERLMKLDRTLDRKLDKIRRLKHGPKSSARSTPKSNSGS